MSNILRVLMVEDSEEDAALTLRALRAGGYSIECQRVDHADAFRSALADRDWDVVLSDHRMATFDSTGALEILQETGADVPFLIVSGTIGEETAVRAMQLGAKDYIPKSNLVRLVPAVERELHDASVRRARREAERRLRDAEERYRTLVEQLPAVTYLLSSGATPRCLYVSPQIETMLGIRPETWTGTEAPWRAVLHPDDRRRVFQQFEQARVQGRHWVAEYRVVRSDGATLWIRDEGRWLVDEATGEARLHGFVLDMTERKRIEQTIEHLALQDPLTRLPNRVALIFQLERAIERARTASRPLALLRVRLDRFREIHNTLGRENSETLLGEVAERLRQIPQADVVARIGGSEFVLLSTARDAEAALRLAESTVRILEAPVVVAELPVEVGARVGIAMFPGHGEDGDLLLRRADVALDNARRTIDGYAVYSSQQDPHDPRRLLLMAELRHAIETDQLRLEYQPKIHLGSQQVVGAEALVRWTHPTLGHVRPDEFVGLAEESALIRPLTRWVLNEAVRQVRSWRQQGLELRVSVNLSARNLHDADLPRQIDALLQTWGVPANSIMLELTESAMMVDPDHVARLLRGLDERGVEISIDDFGTGYSSLAYLRRLPVSELKIDRSFVTGLSANQGDLAIVRTVIALGHHLDLQVVAEGVEDARTWELLANAGCDLAQGYHMARPMPAADFVRWTASTEYGLAAPDKEIDGSG